MVDVHLFDNYSAPITASVNGPTTTFEIGTNFYSDEALPLTQLRWYRWSTGTPSPSNLRLWDVSTGAVVATAASVPNNGSIGWQTHTFPVSPLTLVAGRSYIVSMSTPVNFPISNGNTSVAFVPSSPLHFESNVRSYRLNSFLIPNTFDSAVYHLVDVGVGASIDEAPPEAPVTNESLDARLAAWLDKDSTDYADSTPILTYAAVTDGTIGLSAIKAAIVAAATNVTTVLGRTASLTGGTIQTALNDLATTVSNSFISTLNAVQSRLDTIDGWMTAFEDFWNGKWGGPTNAIQWTDPGWVEVDSGAFTGTFEVQVHCDRIYVHITTVGADNTEYLESGRSFGSFPWWWCPFYANMQGRYHTSRAREAVLYEPGMRMDGALVVLPPDFEGTWSAARFDG